MAPTVTELQKFYDPIKCHNAATFSSLYKVRSKSHEKLKQTVLKADRMVLQHLITAYGGGRRVDLEGVLQHELLPVPISLAEMNGTLHTGNKSVLDDILTTVIICPESVKKEGTSCLIINGQALVISIG